MRPSAKGQMHNEAEAPGVIKQWQAAGKSSNSKVLLGKSMKLLHKSHHPLHITHPHSYCPKYAFLTPTSTMVSAGCLI
jgi:hypothetical protein